VSDTAPSGRSVARRARRPTACDSPASGRCCSPPAPPQRRSLAGQQHRTRTLRKPTTPNHNQLTYASTRLGPTSSSEKRPTAAGRARDGGNSGLGGGLHDRGCDVLAGEQDRAGVVAQPVVVELIVLSMSRRYGAAFGFTSYDPAWGGRPEPVGHPIAVHRGGRSGARPNPRPAHHGADMSFRPPRRCAGLFAAAARCRERRGHRGRGANGRGVQCLGPVR
jgi:hypothetical protein